MPLSDDKDFLALPPNEQTRYLQETDPDFKGLSSADQAAYLAHVTNQPLQEQPKQGVLGAAKESFSKLNPFGSSTPQPVGDMNAQARQMYQERKSERGWPYALGAGVAEGFGADVPGMEESAKAGDPGGVIGHALPGMGLAAAPLAVEGMARSIPPAIRGIARGTNAALSKAPGMIGAGIGGAIGHATGVPYATEVGAGLGLAAGKEIFPRMRVPGEYFGMQKPEFDPRLGTMAKNAVDEGRASALPTTLSGDQLPPKIGATEKIPVTPGFKTPRVGQQEKIPVRPGMNPIGGKSGMIPINPEATFLPEPREQFPGEQPGLMQSVPREELSDLAMRRKPGAGQQMQQLGKPVIYIPRGSDLP